MVETLLQTLFFQENKQNVLNVLGHAIRDRTWIKWTHKTPSAPDKRTQVMVHRLQQWKAQGTYERQLS